MPRGLADEQDEVYGRKRESVQKYRDDNDKYYAKVQADRQARQDRFKAEKAKEDAERQQEEITRMREDAKLPAYSKEIEDCQILIGWFQGKTGGEVPTTNAGGKGQASLEGVKALEIRQVETEFKGMTLKKKDDDDLAGFFGGSGKGKKKGGKGGSKAASGTATPTPAEGASEKKDAVNLPMSLLSAILSLGIHPPSGKDDVQRTVDDLETKKAWFEANSAAKTKVGRIWRPSRGSRLTYRRKLTASKSLSPRCRRRTRFSPRTRRTRRRRPKQRWTARRSPCTVGPPIWRSGTSSLGRIADA